MAKSDNTFSVMWYGVSYLPKLRAMTNEQRTRLMQELNSIGGEVPLQMYGELQAKEKQKLCFPSWENGKSLTGWETVALMVFSLWVQVGENPEMCSSLYETWPIAEAVMLCPKQELTT